MRFELTDKGRCLYSKEDADGIANMDRFFRAALQHGCLVMKSDDGRTIAECTDLDDTGDDEELDLGIDSSGRDRSLRLGGSSPNERAGGDGGQGNRSPSDYRAAGRATGRSFEERVSGIEGQLAMLVSALSGFPEADIKKAMEQPNRRQQYRDFNNRDDYPKGMRPGDDEDQDPRNFRSYNVRTGRPTGLSTDPSTRRLQDEVFEDPEQAPADTEAAFDRPDNRPRGPWAVHPADTENELARRQIKKALRGRGDFAAGNHADISHEETISVMKSLLGTMAVNDAGRWGL
jgi:hypothetical protein